MASAPKENPPQFVEEIVNVEVATSDKFAELARTIETPTDLPENIDEIKSDVRKEQVAGTFSLKATTAEWNEMYPGRSAAITKAAVDYGLLA